MEFAGELTGEFPLALCSGKTSKEFKYGTHRSVSPEQTLERFSPLMARLGITRIANITHLDRIGTPVFTAIRPNSRALTTSVGKGNTVAAAKTSALMESIESWHAEMFCSPYRMDSLKAISRTSKVVDTDALAKRTSVQFDVSRPIKWCESKHLVTGEQNWVPAEIVNLNYVSGDSFQGIFERSSNGLASGNNIPEAILHGMYEVIERDAWTLWELKNIPQRKETQINTNSIQSSSSYLSSLIKTIENLGIYVGIWDMTSDIGIPTFHCILIENPDSHLWRPVLASSGSGTHLSAEIAISRALNEAIQCRATVISGSRDDQFPDTYLQTITKQHHREVISNLFEENPQAQFIDCSDTLGTHIEQDIRTLVKKLSSVDLTEILVVDLSREDLEVPVVKVIIPGLEGFHEAKGPPGKRASKVLAQQEAQQSMHRTR